MEDDCGIDEIVSQFFLDTCQPRFRVNHTAVKALVDSAVATEKLGICSRYGEFYPIPLITGSVAEFNIDPLLSCIGDTDVMFYNRCELAIPADYPPPTELLPEFDCREVDVHVGEIIDSAFPGYIYLKFSYLLKLTDDGKYCAIGLIESERSYVSFGRDNSKFHGPALVGISPRIVPAFPKEVQRDLLLDLVCCVRCLLWPSQAADWPSRHRNSGWPDSATVRRVVSNGCDVVGVAHRLCRDDEWMAKYQCRLSFSRAEIVLLNSWTQVQQITYHMLRVFVKTRKYLESNDFEAKTLSNYNIKTLMLWACELKPRIWWSDDFNVVEICVELLHILGVWLRDARCKHYFINKCNLLDHLDESGLHQLTAVKLMSVTVQSLSKWFVDNYIRNCPYNYVGIDLCDALFVGGSPLFDDISTNAKLQDAVTEFVYRKRVARSCIELMHFSPSQYSIVHFVDSYSLTARNCSYLMSELAKIDNSLSVYFAAVVYLHVAYKTSRNLLTGEWWDVITAVYGLLTQMYISGEVHKCFYESLQRFVQYQQRIEIHGHHTTPVIPCELNTSERVEILQQSAVELLTMFRQLQARYFGSEVPVATRDFEALYAYKCGNYQRCLQLAKHSLSLSTVSALYALVGVFMLPEFIQFLDDDIVSLVGLKVIVGLTDPSCRDEHRVRLRISQHSLLLYLIAQCQMKLRHSMTSLAQTLDYFIEVARFINLKK